MDPISSPVEEFNTYSQPMSTEERRWLTQTIKDLINEYVDTPPASSQSSDRNRNRYNLRLISFTYDLMEKLDLDYLASWANCEEISNKDGEARQRSETIWKCLKQTIEEHWLAFYEYRYPYRGYVDDY